MGVGCRARQIPHPLNFFLSIMLVPRELGRLLHRSQPPRTPRPALPGCTLPWVVLDMIAGRVVSSWTSACVKFSSMLPNAKTGKDVLEDNRGMAMLWKEALRVKTILSTNNKAMAIVESLAWDITSPSLRGFVLISTRTCKLIANALTGCSTNFDHIFDPINISICSRMGCAHC